MPISGSLGFILGLIVALTIFALVTKLIPLNLFLIFMLGVGVGVVTMIIALVIMWYGR